MTKENNATPDEALIIAEPFDSCVLTVNILPSVKPSGSPAVKVPVIVPLPLPLVSPPNVVTVFTAVASACVVVLPGSSVAVTVKLSLPEKLLIGA